ncbi:tRNA lysidine(34) synthetase TilS [Bacteroidota bacterium]
MPGKSKNTVMGKKTKSAVTLKQMPKDKAQKKIKQLKLNKRMLINDKDKKNSEIIVLLDKIESCLNRDIYFNPGSLVLLAVSGGVDSITLMDIFANLTLKFPLMKLTVAHYNHRLRGKSSDADEEFVRKMAAKYNIPFFNANGNVKQYAELKGISIEHAARNLRYKYFERTAKKINADYVATAHTSDDSAETFFINLFRGSGITGLSGIPVRRSLIKRISLIRPLIKIRKRDLIKYAELRKLKWKEDETNKLLYYTRNKIRHELMPKIEEQFSPSAVELINRTQKLLQGADSIISKHVQKAIATLIHSKIAGRFAIKLAILQTFDDFLKGEIILKALANNFNIQNLSMQTIDRIIALEDKPVGSICEINKSYYALKDRGILIFAQKKTYQKTFLPIEKEGEFVVDSQDCEGRKLALKKVTKSQVKLSDNPKIEYLDWDLVPSGLYLRSWDEGDTFKPLGMQGKMKISDFFTNEKVPLFDKNKIMLLTSKSDIIWICGMRVSDNFKITGQTTKYLKVEIIDIGSK